MKVLLAAVNAKYIHSNLAVYCLRAYVKERYPESEIAIAEYTINQPFDEILTDLYRRNPDVLCLSCYLWNITEVGQILRETAKILPKTAIWLGGPEVSYNAREVLENYPMVQGIMKGEGEESFTELVAYYGKLKERKQLRDIEGLMFRDENGEIIETENRPILDLSTVPFVYEHIEDFQNRIIYYESSRGCPFSCSYCLSSIDKCLRFRKIELVKKELQFFIDHEVPQVKFVDRTFNCKHDHAMAIRKYITEHDKGITNFHFEVAADLLNEEEIELIRRMRPGLIQLEIGIQSANPKTIREIHRTGDHALTYVEAYGYIDDERYARTYIAYRMDTKSRQKIIRELMGKGIDRKTAINAWEEEAALNMPDEKEILYRTIEKKYSPDTELDEKKMRRLYGYLVRRGFGYSDIADTLENMNIRLVHTYSDES